MDRDNFKSICSRANCSVESISRVVSGEASVKIAVSIKAYSIEASVEGSIEASVEASGKSTIEASVEATGKSTIEASIEESSVADTEVLVMKNIVLVNDF